LDPRWTWPCRDATPAPPSRFRATLCCIVELSGTLFRAELALPEARHIRAVRRAERSVGGRAGFHVALHLRLRRDDRRRRWGLRGGCGGRARDCRSHQFWWHDRRADWRIGRNRCNGDRCRRWPDCGRRTQPGFGVGHRRHRSREPVEPQQYAAKRNHQHRAIDRKPHRFAPAYSCRTADTNTRASSAKDRDIA
jgi:hypothetical protein